MIRPSLFFEPPPFGITVLFPSWSLLLNRRRYISIARISCILFTHNQICTLIQDPHYSIIRICTARSIPLPITTVTKTSTQMSTITKTSTHMSPVLENLSRLWHLTTVRIPWALILYKAINIVICWDKFHTQLR